MQPPLSHQIPAISTLRPRLQFALPSQQLFPQLSSTLTLSHQNQINGTQKPQWHCTPTPKNNFHHFHMKSNEPSTDPEANRRSVQNCHHHHPKPFRYPHEPALSKVHSRTRSPLQKTSPGQPMHNKCSPLSQDAAPSPPTTNTRFTPPPPAQISPHPPPNPVCKHWPN